MIGRIDKIIKKIVNSLFIRRFAELAWPHTGNAIHPPPILIWVTRVESLGYRLWAFKAGYYRIDIVDNWIIGVMIFEILCLLMACRTDLNNAYGRVELYISGEIDNVL